MLDDQYHGLSDSDRESIHTVFVQSLGGIYVADDDQTTSEGKPLRSKPVKERKAKVVK